MGFCNLPESVAGQKGAALCQWPMGHRLTWTVVRALPGWSARDLTDIYAASWRSWDEASGIAVEYVSSAARANILIGSRVIDGPAGVLAEAELPCGNIRPDSQLRVWFDEREQWGAELVGKVSLHEFGHSLGLGHDNDGKINAIMDPAVSHITTLQPPDIAQVRLRYGEPAATPAPPEGGHDADLADILEDLARCIRGLSPQRRAAISRWLD